MATLTHLDSHVLVWLYLPRLDLLSEGASAAIDEGELAVSPMAVLELTYLHEIGRLRVDGPAVFGSLARQIGVQIDRASFPEVVERAHQLVWTRDPFDRVIAAQALAAKAVLVSRDDELRQNLPMAVW